MGIKNLTSFLKDHCPNSIRQINLSELNGKKAAIDVSIWLYRFKYKGNKLIPKFFEQINRLRINNITPIYIFDGPPGPEKNDVMSVRKTKKEEKFNKIDSLKNDLLNSDNVNKLIIQNQIDELNNKIISVSREDIKAVKQLFDFMNIKYIRANGEADLLCSKLCTENIVDFVISEDMDLLTSGSKYLLRDFNIYNNKATLYDLDCILNTLNITYDKFVELCILFGCDYLKRISGLGPKKSFKMIKEEGSIESIIGILKQKKTVHDTYIDEFKKSKDIFMNYDISYIDNSALNIDVTPITNKQQQDIINIISKHSKLSYKQIINRLNNIYNVKELSK